MDVEILTIGDELMTGHTVDTNSAFIAEQLTTAGFRIAYKSSAGDNVEQLEDAIKMALRRAPIVVATGGLGPTDDDVTKKAIVKVFKRNLIFHENILEDIRRRYALRGIDMPAINQNQALLPQGATFFPNQSGSAVGICLTEEGRVFIALPGVPFEMRQILVDEVVPYLLKLNQGRAIKVTKLRTTGIVESGLAELIKPEVRLESGVRLAYLPHPGGVDLRVMAEADSKDDADKRVANLVRQLESVIGKYVFGYNDDTLEAVVGQLLKDNDKSLAVAESCTAGQLGALVASVPGSSAYFVGGIIAYSNQVKISTLRVNPEIIDKHGAVSEECALAMAKGCRDVIESDFALSITGIAGPEGGTDDKPVGITFIGLASAHTSYAKKFSFGTSRNVNRQRASYAALEMLRRDIRDIQ